MDSINQAVIAKLQHRAQVGERKYGVTMDRTDLTGVEWLEHLQMELLDAAVYTEKLIQLSGIRAASEIPHVAEPPAPEPDSQKPA